MPSRPSHPTNLKLSQTQPKTYKLSFKAFLSLPFRLCNPPPAVGKVRSCGVTPLLKVRLDDVLDRKHLPPLGLKDFEEWLLFVEMSPENLYFILWLREYKQRYNQWKAQSTFQSQTDHHRKHRKRKKYKHSHDAPIAPDTLAYSQYSAHLAMFYTRAKQTFLTPGSEYELNLTSSLLAPFQKSDTDGIPSSPTAHDMLTISPHPDPVMFIDIELETYRTLEASLRRFVQAQLNNVGNKRVMCGMVAGVVFCLIGALPALGVSFSRKAASAGGNSMEGRWSRLAAFPGLWLGLTILLASLNGICLGVYIFGDLRQLRKFELSRPAISKPQPLPQPSYYYNFGFKRKSSTGGSGNGRPVSVATSLLPIQNPNTAQGQRKMSVMSVTPITDIPAPVYPASALSPPPPAHFHSHQQRPGSITSHDNAIAPSNSHHNYHASSYPSSLSSVYSKNSNSSSEGVDDDCSSEEAGIHISPAYYDEDEMDGPCNLYFSEPDSEFQFPGNVSKPAEVAQNQKDSGKQKDGDSLFKATTASFIRPFEPDSYDEGNIEKSLQTPSQHQPIFPFNFDALPARPPKSTSMSSSAKSKSSQSYSHPAELNLNFPATSLSSQHHRSPSPFAFSPIAFPSSSSFPVPRSYPHPPLVPLQTAIPYPPEPALPSRRGWPSPTSIIARLQERCTIPKWRLQTGYLEEPGTPSGFSFTTSERGRGSPAFSQQTHPPLRSSPYWTEHPNHLSASVNAGARHSREKVDPLVTRTGTSETEGDMEVEKKVRKRFRMVKAVPAFAVPLTRVLSPVVVRGQWEIVMRSALGAFVISWIVIGSLLAVPVGR